MSLVNHYACSLPRCVSGGLVIRAQAASLRRPPRYYAAGMIAYLSGGWIPLLIVVAVAAFAVGWWSLLRFAGSTRAGRHAAHFLDVGDADLPPEQKIKYQNNHPGAGGNG